MKAISIGRSIGNSLYKFRCLFCSFGILGVQPRRGFGGCRGIWIRRVSGKPWAPIAVVLAEGGEDNLYLGLSIRGKH